MSDAISLSVDDSPAACDDDRSDDGGSQDITRADQFLGEDVSSLPASADHLSSTSPSSPPRPPSPNTLAKPYPHPFKDFEDRISDENLPLCLTELRMIVLSATLRSKDRWWEKYKMEAVRKKWKREALEQEIEVLGVRGKLSEKAVDWVMRELEEYDAMRTEEGIEVACADNIYQSDSLIPEALQSAFIFALETLEDVPEQEKDWHPRSNEQVLDVVHPSLYPVVYNRTLYWPSSLPLSERNGGTLRIAHPPNPNDCPEYTISKSFSWLPTPFEISDSGKSCTIKEYINNLHPIRHKEMYEAIALIFPVFIPLFERVLSDLKEGIKRRIENMTYETIWKTEDGNYPNQPDDVDYEAWEPIKQKHIEESQILISDVPDEYPAYGVHRFKIPFVSLRGMTLKVIVKIASIYLTPEKPTYNGGTWHVEGMRNERIVATGIWYISEKNVSESRLAFRMRTDWPDQYEYKESLYNWGLTLDSPLNQPLGSVQTKQGRCLAFPNLHQHCVSPFSLLDPSKAGHRKILVFFLSDPNVSGDEEVLDTSQVPPQQQDWYTDELEGLPLDSPLRKLPNELLAKVGQEIDGLTTLEETKSDRLKLMAERTAFVNENDARFFSVGFNMCMLFLPLYFC
ncbi:hypothetical protein BT69DRAFT_1225906 [Atractiella rhizophila]|nr:hypothetical protein BT69DRAFT_1225906 [Atractiella rhizophila]